MDTKQPRDKAKRELGVESIRERVPGPWLWVLPNQKGGMTEAPTLPNPTLPTDTKLKTFGNLGNVAWNTAFFDDSPPQDCQHCQLGNLAGNLGDVEANETLPTSNQSESTKDTTPKGGSDRVDLSEIGTHDAKTITSSQKGGRPKTVFKVMTSASTSTKLHEQAVLRSYVDVDVGDKTTPQPPTGEPENDTTPKGGDETEALMREGSGNHDQQPAQGETGGAGGRRGAQNVRYQGSAGRPVLWAGWYGRPDD